MKTICRYISVFAVIVFGVLLVSYVFYSNQQKTENFNTEFSLVVKEQGSFWFYEIYRKDTLIIRQEYIPVVEGMQKFKSKKDAEVLGNVVLQKLLKNEYPIITKDELINSDIEINKILIKY